MSNPETRATRKRDDQQSKREQTFEGLKKLQEVEARKIELPPGLWVAIANARPQFVDAYLNSCASDYNPPDVDALAAALKHVIEYNQALREHCRCIARRTHQLLEILGGAGNVAEDVYSLATFEMPANDNNDTSD